MNVHFVQCAPNAPACAKSAEEPPSLLVRNRHVLQQVVRDAARLRRVEGGLRGDDALACGLGGLKRLLGRGLDHADARALLVPGVADEVAVALDDGACARRE